MRKPGLLTTLLIVGSISVASADMALVTDKGTLPVQLIDSQYHISSSDGEIVSDPSGAIRAVIHDFSQFEIEQGNIAFFSNHEGVVGALVANIRDHPASIAGVLTTLDYDGANFFLVSPHGISLSGGRIVHAGDIFLSGGHGLDASDFTDSMNNIDLGEITGDVFLSAGDLISLAESGTIAVIGRDVSLVDESSIGFTQSGGHVDITATGPTPGRVTLIDERLAVGETELSGMMLIKDSDIGDSFLAGNKLGIQGGSVQIVDSRLFTETDGVDAGTLTIEAFEAVDISSTQQTELRTFSDSGIKTGDIIINSHKGSVRIAGKNTLLSTSGNGADAGAITIEAIGVSIIERARIEARSTGLGGSQAGSITIQSEGTLSLESAASISNEATGKSVPGDIKLLAEQDISVIGTEEHPTIVSSNGGGSDTQAGNILVSASGGTIRIGPYAKLETLATGDGSAGNIVVDASTGTISVTNGVISAGTIETSTGTGGSVNLRANKITLQDGAEISAKSNGSGNSGNVQISAEELLIEDATINVSTKQSDAGNLSLNTASRLSLDAGASLQTSVEGSGVSGGDIAINRQGQINTIDAEGNASATPVEASDQSIFLLMNGSIITRVGSTSSGNGGNVLINESPADNLVVLSDQAEINTSAVGNSANTSAVNHRALGGQGGNLTIAALTVYQSPAATIDTRGAQAGLDGEVEFNTPGIDETSGMVALPEAFLDISRLTRNRCVARFKKGSSSLVINKLRHEDRAPQEIQAAYSADVQIAYQAGEVQHDGQNTPMLRVMTVADCRQ